MTTRRFCSIVAMTITAAVIFGFATAIVEMQRRARLSDQLAQWQLEEWKENLLDERQREFLGRSK